ncbi:MAG TPA: acetyltransferase [Cyanobacteria bacterium UBA8553]|nr:acetyltransferase [Cyanobacteria bacterium UBA8553]
MLLEHRPSGDLLEVLTPEALYNPCRSQITGQLHAGEEMQDPELFHKSELIFPSGEPLPRCWIDANYRNKAVRHTTVVIGG